MWSYYKLTANRSAADRGGAEYLDKQHGFLTMKGPMTLILAQSRLYLVCRLYSIETNDKQGSSTNGYLMVSKKDCVF